MKFARVACIAKEEGTSFAVRRRLIPAVAASPGISSPPVTEQISRGRTGILTHDACSSGQISTTPYAIAQGVCDTISTASAIVAASIKAKPATGSGETI